MAIRDKMIRWTPAPFVHLFSAPYIAGSSRQDAIDKVDALWKESGLASTLDLLGEGIQGEEDVAAEVKEYLELIESIDHQPTTISLKPTQMGLAINPTFCYDNLCKLLDKAKERDIQVTIDMEESRYTDATLELHRALREKYDNVGTVLQSRLFRTEADVDRYLSGFKAHIRLCIGIYPEPAEIAHQQKAQIKENFVKVLEKLWDNKHFVALATHDEVLLRRCLDLARTKGISKDQYEIQMLLGVPRVLIQKELLAQGLTVRLYVPYATTKRHALAYCKRRMAENPHMILYVLGNLWRHFKNWIFRRAHDPTSPQ